MTTMENTMHMNIDQQYLDLVSKILNTGQERPDRTGTGVIGLFGEDLTFDLADGFPMLNTKQVGGKWALVETLWMFVQGSSDMAYLDEHKVSIWDEWAIYNEQYPTGTIGNVYGPIIRGRVPKVEHQVDQIAYVIDLLKNDPYSRRICMTAWDPDYLPIPGKSFETNVMLGRGVLAPCHSSFIQFYVSDKEAEHVVHELLKAGIPLKDFENLNVKEAIQKFNLKPKRLNAFTHQRSADLGLGVPFNLLQISSVTSMLAQVTGYSPGNVKYSFGDLHIYQNHIDGLSEQLQRKPLDHYPELIINPSVKNFDDFTLDHFKIEGYKHQGKLILPVSV